MSKETKIPVSGAGGSGSTVYVDIDDDISSIIDKLETASGKEVRLVLPKRAAVLQSIVNMRLLKRSAQAANKEPVLVTTEAALLPLAGAIRLAVAKSAEAKAAVPPAPGTLGEPAPTPGAREDGTGPVDLKSAKKAGAEAPLPTKIEYGKPIGDLASSHESDNPETIELDEPADKADAVEEGGKKTPKAPKDSKVKVPNFNAFRNRLALAAVGLVLLIVLLYFALSVLPKATIAVTTTGTPVSANLNLSTSATAKSLDEQGGTIPGYSKTMDQTGTQTVNASGQQNNGNKATGTVTMSITTNCATDVTKLNVPQGTGISSDGLTFIMQKSTNFHPPPAQTTPQGCTFTSDVPVTAQTGGAKYNLASGSSFTTQGYPSVSGQNSSAFSGGTDNITVVVSQSDVDSAVNNFKSASADTFTKTFEDQLGQQGYWVLVSTLKAGNPHSTANPAVGEKASSTTVSIKITYTVLCIKKTDLTKALTDALNQQINTKKQKVTTTDILSHTNVAVGSQASSTVASLNIGVTASAVPLINDSDVKKVAEGQKSGYITAQLEDIPGIKSVTVKLSPFWVSKVPKKASKITVILTH